MAASKRERIEKISRDITHAHPFASLEEARTALEMVIRRVEDELSGMPEDPHADEKIESDGRIYPPTDKRELRRKSPFVRTFRHVGHKTSFGENGAILIEALDGSEVLNLSGKDGRRVYDLLQEQPNE